MTLDEKIKLLTFLLTSMKNYGFVLFVESRLEYIYYNLFILDTPETIIEFLAKTYQLYLKQ